MSNLYGYLDYRGPQERGTTGGQRDDAKYDFDGVDNECEDDEELNPLQAGFWMPGDSLAPPCGTSTSTIRQLLDFAQVERGDVLYDLGCGDGRICLEAWYHCQAQTVGIEIEQDLVQRFEHLISKAKEDHTCCPQPEPLVIHQDLKVVLQKLVVQQKAVTQNEVCRRDEYNGQSKARLLSLDLEGGLPVPTILVLFLLPDAMDELEPILVDLIRTIPHLRVICSGWRCPNLQASRICEVKEVRGGQTTFWLCDKHSLIS